ncbi:MAG: hypothetical protein MN733_10110, partial [Nitrososphaera sp.]|nr:hypothetical protein [Nitrososphaera sp.]
ESYILSTNTGSAFISTFNTVYYSFSPQVADYERDHPWMQQTVKTMIYPLLGILGISERAYWVADGGEFGSILAGAAASFMIGAVYISPVLALATHIRRMMKLNKRNATILIAIVSVSVAGLAITTLTGSFLEIGTGGFVVVLTAISALVVSALWRRLALTIRTFRKKNGHLLKK